MKLFVYATLKKIKIQEEVLGHKAKDIWPKANLTGYRETFEKDAKGERFPTLKKYPPGMVEGELFDVTDEELKKLDGWESSYKRMPVKLSDGESADTYLRKK